jgi:polysaccharide biosynthesis transport protein
MNMRQFFLILRARCGIALFVFTCVIATALAASFLLPRQYTASAAVVLDVRSPDPIAGMMLPTLVIPGYIATQLDIINSDRVARRVVKMLRLEDDPLAREQWLEATAGQGSFEMWLAARLKRRLTVEPARQSSVITITYKASDPERAAAVANAFAQAYLDVTVDLKVEPARQYTEWFEQQGRALRSDVERAQARLSQFQQKHRIVANDERLDNETAKLAELSTHLTIAQAQAAEAQSRQRTGAASATLPEVVQNPLIQNLKFDIARQEAKLQELAGNLGRNHPQYQRMAAELASLKGRLEAETAHITSGFTTVSGVSRDKEVALRSAVEAQRSKLLQLRRQRDELAVLTRDVETAQKAYEAVTQRLNQTRLESRTTQTNASILTAAVAPVEPSSPKIPLNVALGVILGTLLAVGAAVVREIFDRRIRSAQDLVEIAELPVLGVVGNTSKRRALLFGPRVTPALPNLGT